LNRQLKIWGGILAALVALYFLNSRSQNKLVGKLTPVFTGDADSVQKITIFRLDDGIEIVKNAESQWEISGNDTLVVKADQMQRFTDQVLGLDREAAVSINPDRYATYSVDDSAGTHLVLMGYNDVELGRYVFGRSQASWNKNYIRVGDDPAVYQTSQSVLHLVTTNVNSWGETPKEEIPEAGGSSDSTFVLPHSH